MNSTGAESDLAEVHRLLSLTRSAVVRDRLHALLNELIQAKHQLLAGAAVEQAAGSPAAASSSAFLAADFARNASLNGGGHTAATASSAALHPPRGSLTDTGDTRSSTSGGNTPIEPIGSSSTVLAASRGGQQDAVISPFDPVWQPGGAAAAALPLINSSFGLGREQLAQQQPGHPAGGHGLGAIDGFAVPQHMRASLASSPMMQQPGQQMQAPPGGSHLGPAAAAGMDTRRPYNVNPPPRQQQGTLDGLMGIDAAALAGAGMLGGAYGDFGGVKSGVSLGALAAGSHFGNSELLAYGRQQQQQQQQRNLAGGGIGYYGGPAAKPGFGGGLVRPYGSGGLPYGNAGPHNALPAPYPFGNGIHPALQYGIDLRSGEMDAMGMPLFRPLTTFSWEQSDGLIKIYVPLRGVQTDLLKATFTPTSVEVRVVGLQGKNYVYAVKNTYYPINPDGCHVAASKTKKNVLITLQKLNSNSPDEKHWRDLSAN